MIGIDTNVLVRYLVRDDEAQTTLATALLEKRCTTVDPGYVEHIVLCELVWVLESAYGYRKPLVASVLAGLLEAAEIHLEHPHPVAAALADYRAGSADFSDYLIAHRHRAAGCRATASFDRKALGHRGFTAVQTLVAG